MYLIHTTDEKSLYNILLDGKLRSSKETKNVRLFGYKEGSKYIYLRLGKKNDYANIYLDSKLLLENIFYLQLGWSGEPTTEKIDGRKLTEEQLLELLKNFNNKVNAYINKNKNKLGYIIQMSNEIIVEKSIKLKNYLKMVNISKYNKKINDIINDKYNDVILHY